MNDETIVFIRKHLTLIENYSKAVCTVQARWFDATKSEEMNTAAQSEKINSLFVLDTLIESNNQLLAYLNRIKQHDNVFSTHALNQLFNKLAAKEDENINETIRRLQEIMISDWPEISNNLRDEYSDKSTTYYRFSLIVTALVLLSGGLAIVCPPSPIIIFPIALMIAALISACLIKMGHYYEQPSENAIAKDNGRLEYVYPLWVKAYADDKHPTSRFTKSYDADFNKTETHGSVTTVTRLKIPERKSPTNFFFQKLSNDLGDEIMEEYNKISRDNI